MRFRWENESHLPATFSPIGIVETGRRREETLFFFDFFSGNPLFISRMNLSYRNEAVADDGREQET